MKRAFRLRHLPSSGQMKLVPVIVTVGLPVGLTSPMLGVMEVRIAASK